ncbi:uncharacterized protein LOC124808513 [Hydra vulgaris]|uniref:uncharacterized protein LOC124808513 n=1 Tax=Hydra vulgaris TaxID=6087 RepID=UPI0032E9EE91
MWKRAVWQEDLQEEEGVIPSNWIDNKTVYWPPGTKALNAMKARQNPEKNWLKFPLIKVKFSSESKQDCENFDFTTTEEKSDNEDVDFHRKRKYKQREFPDYFPSSVIKDLDEVSMFLTSSSSSIKSIEPKVDMDGKNLNSPFPKFFQEDINSSLFFKDIAHDEVKESGNKLQKLDNVDKFPMSEGKFQKRVLYLLTDIRNEMRNQNRLIEPASNSEFVNQIRFISSEVELTEVDKTLDDEKVRLLWVNQLQLIGGTSLKDKIHKIMLRIFSNSFMATMSMKGKNGKICFKNTNLYGVVKASTIKYDGATENLINGVLSDFLKYAPFRKGGGKEKKL